LNEEFSNEKISTLMIRLQAEMLNLILRMANEFPQRKEQLIFIINNYDLMLSVLTVRKWIVLIAYHIDRTGPVRSDWLRLVPGPVPIHPTLVESKNGAYVERKNCRK
jgi:hypothetical protein